MAAPPTMTTEKTYTTPPRRCPAHDSPLVGSLDGFLVDVGFHRVNTYDCGCRLWYWKTPGGWRGDETEANQTGDHSKTHRGR